MKTFALLLELIGVIAFGYGFVLIAPFWLELMVGGFVLVAVAQALDAKGRNAK